MIKLAHMIRLFSSLQAQNETNTFVLFMNSLNWKFLVKHFLLLTTVNLSYNKQTGDRHKLFVITENSL